MHPERRSKPSPPVIEEATFGRATKRGAGIQVPSSPLTATPLARQTVDGAPATGTCGQGPRRRRELVQQQRLSLKGW